VRLVEVQVVQDHAHAVQPAEVALVLEAASPVQVVHLEECAQHALQPAVSHAVLDEQEVHLDVA